MRVSGAPQILAQWVLHVSRISDYKGKYTHPTDHHGRQDNQEDAGQKARSVSHDCLHSVREPFDHNDDPRRGLKLMGLRQFRYLALPVEARGAGSDILDRRPRPWRSSQVFALVIMVLLDKLSWQGWN